MWSTPTPHVTDRRGYTSSWAPTDRSSLGSKRIHIRTASVADPAGDLRKEWQAQRLRIEEWWRKLDPATQEWLIANNGDVVPTTVLGKIAEAGGEVTSDASSIGDNGPGGFLHLRCRGR